jgi:hypothetical protein
LLGFVDYYSFQIGIQIFFTKQKSMLAWVCYMYEWSFNGQNRCLLGFVICTNEASTVKIGACLDLLYVRMKLQRSKSVLAWVCYMYEWNFDGSFILVGFSRTGTERLKNRNGTGPRGIDGLKNRSGKCKGSTD